MPNIIPSTPYAASTNTAIKQILKGEGNKLYAWDGISAQYIPEIKGPGGLEDLVFNRGYKDTRAPLSQFQPSKTGNSLFPGSSTATAPQTNPTGQLGGLAAAPAPQDPLTTFNLRVLDMLKQAQGAAGNEGLYAQQTALQRATIGREATPTPEELRVLSPSQQEAIRSGKVSALEPEIDAVGAKIKAQDARLQNFESILGTVRQIGQDTVKITPSQDVIAGYVNMLRAGGNATSVPSEVRDKVFAAMTDADWKINAAANSQKPTSVLEYEYAKGQGYKGTYEQYQNEDANRKARAAGGGQVTSDEKAFYNDIADVTDKLINGKWQWGQAFNYIRSKWNAPSDIIDNLLDKNTWAKPGAYEFQQQQRAASQRGA